MREGLRESELAPNLSRERLAEFPKQLSYAWVRNCKTRSFCCYRNHRFASAVIPWNFYGSFLPIYRGRRDASGFKAVKLVWLSNQIFHSHRWFWTLLCEKIVLLVLIADWLYLCINPTLYLHHIGGVLHYKLLSPNVTMHHVDMDRKKPAQSVLWKKHIIHIYLCVYDEVLTLSSFWWTLIPLHARGLNNGKMTTEIG